MKIRHLRKEVHEKKTTVLADVVWEDCDYQNYTMFFEVTGSLGEKLTANPHAFLLGGLFPAFHFGERRVQIEGAVCPELLHGLKKAIQILNNWYYESKKPVVTIEPTSEFFQEKKPHPHSAFFFSGGVDSFAVLRENHLNYAKKHPRFFRDGIVVFGLEVDDPKSFSHVISHLEPAAKEAGIELVTVNTNIYLEYRPKDAKQHFQFWIDEFGGAALAAIAHALSDKYTDVSIAGNCDPNLLCPWGTHPILDPCFSSSSLTVRHEGISSSRIEKIRSIADWGVALRHLRVCNRYKKYNDDLINCGKCEKCVRTMLEFLAVGSLEKVETLPVKTISPTMVRQTVKITNPFIEKFYKDLVGPLKDRGREDLSEAVLASLKKYRSGNSFGRRYCHNIYDRCNMLLKSMRK